MHTKLILIVEDDEELRSSLERHLSENGFRTISASNGREGLDSVLFDKLKHSLGGLHSDLTSSACKIALCTDA